MNGLAPDPAEKRLSLLIPLYAGYRQWFGGMNYIVNLLRILERLPPSEAPDVTVFDDAAGEWPDYVRTACTGSNVARVVGPGGTLLWVRDDEERQRLESIEPHARRRRLAMAADAIFPMPFSQHEAITTARHWAWIPDFQHRHLPHLFPARELAERDSVFAALADREGPILFSSRDAEADFRRFYPDHRSSPYVWSFTSTLDSGSGEDPQLVRERYHLAETYLYIPNQFWIHKDHETAFKAVERLCGQGTPLTLACTGSSADPRGDSHYAGLFEWVAARGLQNRIRHLGVVEQSTQIGLLRGCTAVLQPSLFEGWSTVIEDARAIGCPIIASDLPVHREQLGEDAFYFQAGNPEDMTSVLAGVLPLLSPGPVAEREQEASRRNKQRQLTCARALLACMHADIAARPTQDGGNRH
ncbi:glycosyltransferase (plasmid) [Azospirillum sp. A29]|uniref:glycosyltransferase n=1 Tax=Azospirillum sp. A29 TaxID=3160606 RepID=UPI003672914C